MINDYLYVFPHIRPHIRWERGFEGWPERRALSLDGDEHKRQLRWR